MFTDYPTFGDKDCGLREENEKQQKENQPNLRLRAQAFKRPENLDEGRRKESKKRRNDLAKRQRSSLNSELVKRSIQKKWNLDQFLEEASQGEDINQQVKDMKEDFKISKVGHESEDFPPKSGKWSRRNLKKKPLRPPGKRDHKKEEKKKGKSCGYCGKIGAHPPGRNCPAYGQQRLKCGKYNHYASCCRTGGTPREIQRDQERAS